MPNLSVQNIKNILSGYGQTIKKTPWFLGSHAFAFILLFVALELLLGGFLFYHYILSEKSGNVELVQTPETFQEKTYQSVLQEWKKRETFFERAGDQAYNNPF